MTQKPRSSFVGKKTHTYICIEYKNKTHLTYKNTPQKARSVDINIYILFSYTQESRSSFTVTAAPFTAVQKGGAHIAAQHSHRALMLVWPPKELPCAACQVLGLEQVRCAYCNTLQRTATHFNTLQHTATHYNTHCNTMQHTATHYNALQHTATHPETH